MSILQTFNVGGFPTSLFLWTLVILSAIIVGYMVGATRRSGYSGSKGGKAQKYRVEEEDFKKA